MTYPLLDYNGGVFAVVEACNKRNSEQYTNDDFQLLSIFCQQAEKTIRHALHTHTLKQNIRVLFDKITELQTPPLIFDSKEIKNQVDIMSCTNWHDQISPILINGDPGTGRSFLKAHS